MERALAGEKVITRDGRDVSEIYNFNTCLGDLTVAAVIEGLIFLSNIHGLYSNIGKENDTDLLMAPREPEYQTVWVNLYDEMVYGNNVMHCSQAYINKNDAIYNLGLAGKAIGTFPITFKKP